MSDLIVLTCLDIFGRHVLAHCIITLCSVFDSLIGSLIN